VHGEPAGVERAVAALEGVGVDRCEKQVIPEDCGLQVGRRATGDAVLQGDVQNYQGEPTEDPIHRTDHVRLALDRSKIKEEQIEEYILQLFRKYDSEGESETLDVSRNMLLLFNLLKRCPLSSEKELLSSSLLPKLVLRKCLNLLVTEGLVNYYPESASSTLYRIATYSEIEGRFINNVAQSILNLHLASSNRTLAKEELLKYECMINNLDDTLLLFGY
jgi:hypothetical protein